MIEEDDIQFMKRLGFTSAQAKVYLTLVELGQTSAKSIAFLAQIARQEVYRVLNELESEGFVERVLTSPIEFRACSAELSFASMIRRKKKEIMNLEESTNQFVQKLKESNLGSMGEEHSEFTFVNEKAISSERTRSLGDCAKTSVDVITNLERWLFFNSRFRTNIMDSLDRNVKHRVIIEMPEGETISEKEGIPKSVLSHPNYSVRFLRHEPRVTVVIADCREASIFVTENKRVATNMLRTNNRKMVGIISQYFEDAWSRANRLKKITPLAH
jgi:sugar-specific transcriptional regulator TrmB